MFNKEIQLLQRLQHIPGLNTHTQYHLARIYIGSIMFNGASGVIRLYALVDGEPSSVLNGAAIMDRYPTDCTSSEFRRGPPAMILEMCFKLASSLLAIHDCGVAHGDVKPHNAVVDMDSWKAVWIDIGFTHTKGTKGFRSPERQAKQVC